MIDKKENYKCILLKWVFTYKIDFDEYLIKYKARIVIRDDLQNVDNAQNMYAATLAAKFFRMMMIFVVDFIWKHDNWMSSMSFLTRLTMKQCIVTCRMNIKSLKKCSK